MNGKKIKLDKNYEFVKETKGAYHDNLTEAVNIISSAKSNNLISEKEASFILKIVISKEFQDEAKEVILQPHNRQDVLSLFMNMKRKNIKHA